MSGSDSETSAECTGAVKPPATPPKRRSHSEPSFATAHEDLARHCTALWRSARESETK